MQARTKTIVEAYLEEQQRLETPVARYATTHATVPALEPVYRDLIPLTTPGSGEQYAFEVELDSCSGCKACVSACHSLNGLDDTEAWRDVGLLIGGTPAAPFQQTVTTACHHCADPSCLNGCPVLAYEKDPRTGIVRHLDDQCIGCQYCVLQCPYDVPKYNARLGIVRKCDMCHQRLSAGEAPACVQACPTQAIRIVTVRVRDSSVAARVDTSQFLQGAPDPSVTQPTTRYLIGRGLPDNVRSADAAMLRPQPPHWPLAGMLTLLPAAVGLQFSQFFLPPSGGDAPPPWLPLAVGLGGLLLSVLHLGQPLRAWKIFLGLRTSWLSREAVLFGAWAAFTLLQFDTAMFAPMAVFTGVLGLLCSVMIYVDTHRSFWRFSRTAPRILGVTVVCALAPAAPRLAALALALKLAFEAMDLRGDAIHARLQRGPLRAPAALRFGLGALGVLGLAFGPVGTTLLTVLGSELAGRHLFFRAVDAPKMPGMPAASGSEERAA